VGVEVIVRHSLICEERVGAEVVPPCALRLDEERRSLGGSPGVPMRAIGTHLKSSTDPAFPGCVRESALRLLQDSGCGSFGPAPIAGSPNVGAG